MIVDGSQIIPLPYFILVVPYIENAITFVGNEKSKIGTVADVYSGCDWVSVSDVVAYKTEGVDKMTFESIVYDVVPKQNILFIYIASLA